MKIQVNSKSVPLWIALVSGIFFLPFLGGVHLFDWDEINFAEIAREMLVSGNFIMPQINFQPFWEKPPFFFWLQALAMEMFGVGEYAARFPNAVAGIVVMLILYSLGRKIKDSRFGLLWALAWFGSVLPHLYFKSGIIDPVFNLFIYLGIWYMIRMVRSAEEGSGFRSPFFYNSILSGIFIGLAVLTKGPVGLLIPGLVFGSYWVLKRFRNITLPGGFALITIITAVVAMGWFAFDLIYHDGWFVKTFTQYQIRLLSTEDAGHGGFPGYHFIVTLIGCFPASWFAIHNLFKRGDTDKQLQPVRYWMVILLLVVLILFSFVQSKIVHYSSMVYYPVSFLAALSLYRIINKEVTVPVWLKTGLWITGGLFVMAVIILPVAGRNIDLIRPLFSKDPFAGANLEASVNWSGWEILPALVLLAAMVLWSRLLNRGRLTFATRTLFLGTALFVQLTLFFFIGRIEAYSQRAAVEFCESLADKECYITTYGYKSYVPWFYGRVKPGSDTRYFEKDWLLHGDIDKDVYILAKIMNREELDKMPQLEFIGEKNGFLFYRRSVDSTTGIQADSLSSKIVAKP
ncbi:MAG: phospholipid carrier-dependent glycosyltransferase [Bacteroidales bacterium]